jgi:hypothetical protein
MSPSEPVSQRRYYLLLHPTSVTFIPNNFVSISIFQDVFHGIPSFCAVRNIVIHLSSTGTSTERHSFTNNTLESFLLMMSLSRVGTSSLLAIELLGLSK